MTLLSPSRREGLVSTGFNPNVHGARGLFAFIVFLFHVFNSGLPTFPILTTGLLDAAMRSTEYGVELFFCISGYVIVGSLASRRSMGAFLRDRAIRILPVLWTTLLVIIPLGWLAHKTGDDLPLATLSWLLPANMALLPGALPLPAIHPAAWSLSYEAVFYLVCAAGWVLARPAGAGPMLVVVAPVASLLVCFHPRGLFFLSGVLALWQGSRIPRWISRFPVLWLGVFLAAWHVVQSVSPEHTNTSTLYGWSGDGRLPLALLAFVAATIGFSGLVDGCGVLGRALRSMPLQWLGTISYSLYLWHPIVMSIAKQAMLRLGVVALTGQGAQMFLLVAALPPSLLVALASQRLVERRFGRWLYARTGPSTRQLSVDPPYAADVSGEISKT